MPTVPSYPHDIFTDEVLLEPYDTYRELRELGPVVWLEAHEMYAVPRYEQARFVLGEPGTFCCGQGVGLNEVVNGIAAGGNTLMTDGPLHDHLRGFIARGLGPRALRGLRADIDVLAAECVAAVVEQGSFDAVTQLARAVPLTIVPDLVGWPAGEREHLLDWASAAFDMMGPLNARAQRAGPQMHAMLDFVAKTAAGGDLVPGGLGAAVLEAARRGEVEARHVPGLIVDYLAPSLDTTISAIGNAIWLLGSHPDQWAALKADPDLVPNAFNEVLRFRSPVRAFTRVTTDATTLAGADLEAGSRLMILYPSANRDERHFERPDTFDVTRSNAGEQLAFGYGVHSCAGQSLARLEGQAVLRALVARVDSIEVGEPTPVLNNLISGWASLPVTVRPAAGRVVDSDVT